ncbi:MAG: electron transfer flavoprotein subunit beta [Omnitrophica bacterium RBG_13_46_9]|nr:MAG: electron transfer flavoprotein subunit beta [Omnitrophica bacterium RBG_13_46_9]
MHIVICIKQVPNTTQVRINPDTNTLIREGVECIINPFDMYAIEEGIRLREKFGGKITTVSMGPPQAETALREAVSMGSDEAILLTDRRFAGSDTWATSYVLSRAIKKIGDFSIVICGKQASDGDTAQVGPGIATHLDIPQVTYVKKIEDITEKRARVERMTEEGFEIIETPLPCLLTVVKEINEPRLPSLKGMMRAKKVAVTKWNAEDVNCDFDKIGLDGSPTRVIKIFTPPPRKGGVILKGDTHEIVDKLASELRNEL